MTKYELEGPWTGAALGAPSMPIMLRRRRFWRVFSVIALCAVTFGALMGLSH